MKRDPGWLGMRSVRRSTTPNAPHDNSRVIDIHGEGIKRRASLLSSPRESSRCLLMGNASILALRGSILEGGGVCVLYARARKEIGKGTEREREAQGF
jgi:hypothetical protein